jgi:hypothetical protein
MSLSVLALSAMVRLHGANSFAEPLERTRRRGGRRDSFWGVSNVGVAFSDKRSLIATITTQEGRVETVARPGSVALDGNSRLSQRTRECPVD